MWCIPRPFLLHMLALAVVSKFLGLPRRCSRSRAARYTCSPVFCVRGLGIPLLACGKKRKVNRFKKPFLSVVSGLSIQQVNGPRNRKKLFKPAGRSRSAWCCFCRLRRWSRLSSLRRQSTRAVCRWLLACSACCSVGDLPHQWRAIIPARHRPGRAMFRLNSHSCLIAPVGRGQVYTATRFAGFHRTILRPDNRPGFVGLVKPIRSFGC